MAFDLGALLDERLNVSNLNTQNTPPLRKNEIFQEEKIREVPVGRLLPNVRNFYNISEDEEFSALVESIREHGLMHPITVCPVAGIEPEGFRIISGHRRFTACKKVGMETIPCIIAHPADADEEFMMMIEGNKTTRVLTSWEKGEQVRIYTELISKKRKDGSLKLPAGMKTREAVAKVSGISAAEQARLKVISEKLVVLTDQYKHGSISKDTAYAIAQLEKEQQFRFMDYCDDRAITNIIRTTVTEFLKHENEPTLEQQRRILYMGTPLSLREYMNGMMGSLRPKSTEVRGVVRLAYTDKWDEEQCGPDPCNAPFTICAGAAQKLGETYSLYRLENGLHLALNTKDGVKQVVLDWYGAAILIIDMYARNELLNKLERDRWIFRQQQKLAAAEQAKKAEQEAELKEVVQQTEKNIASVIKDEPKKEKTTPSWMMHVKDCAEEQWPNNGDLCILFDDMNVFFSNICVFVDGNWWDDDFTKYVPGPVAHLWAPIPYPPDTSSNFVSEFIREVRAQKGGVM